MNYKRGLCSGCCHQQQIPSPKGSVYILCRLALVNDAFRKYPILPVLACSGFEPPRN